MQILITYTQVNSDSPDFALCVVFAHFAHYRKFFAWKFKLFAWLRLVCFNVNPYFGLYDFSCSRVMVFPHLCNQFDRRTVVIAIVNGGQNYNRKTVFV